MKWILLIGLPSFLVYAYDATTYQAVTVIMLVFVALTLYEILNLLKDKLDGIEDKLYSVEEKIDEIQDYN